RWARRRRERAAASPVPGTRAAPGGGPMSTSLQSNALEPPPGRAEGTGLTYYVNALSRQIPVYGLPVVGLLLILIFGILLDGFVSWTTLKFILISKSVVAILALA